MTKEELQKNAIDTVYKGYRGKNIIVVSHPDFGVCRCVAPNEDAALLAATRFWNKDCNFMKGSRQR